MKGKLVINDGIVSLQQWDDAANLNAYTSALQQYGVDDNVMHLLAQKSEDRLTDADKSMLSIRKSLDKTYTEQVQQHADYKTIVYGDTPSIPATSTIRTEYEETDDAILVKYVEEKFSKLNTLSVIKQIEEELATTDFKVLKAYECKIMDEPMPDGIEEVIASRRALRAKIAELEAKIKDK